MRTPALVAISHGTSSAEGRAAVRALRDAVEAALARRADGAPRSRRRRAARRPGDPRLARARRAGRHRAAAALRGLPRARRPDREPSMHRGDRTVTLAGALGPDDRLIDVMRTRCAETGSRDDDVLVLAVAGSSDARAARDCRATAGCFAARSRREVRVGFLSAADPRLGRDRRAPRGAAGRAHRRRQLPARAGLLPRARGARSSRTAAPSPAPAARTATGLPGIPRRPRPRAVPACAAPEPYRQRSELRRRKCDARSAL